MVTYRGIFIAACKFICCASTVVVFICLYSSCRLIRAEITMHSKIPKEKKVLLKNKEIRFIPIVHFGQKEFYQNLKEKILVYKAAGYVVYYEQTIMKFDQQNISHEAYDTVRRKFRKMTGNQNYTREHYQQELGGVFKNMQVQPEYDSLGVSSSDINADVTIVQMTNEYERLYGKIVLDSCDNNSPPGSDYICNILHNSMLPIIRDFRSRNLATMIKNAPENKILVIYGRNHIRPVKRMLRANYR